MNNVFSFNMSESALPGFLNRLKSAKIAHELVSGSFIVHVTVKTVDKLCALADIISGYSSDAIGL